MLWSIWRKAIEFAKQNWLYFRSMFKPIGKEGCKKSEDGITTSTSLLTLFLQQRPCTTKMARYVFMLRQAIACVWMYLEETGKLTTYTQVRSKLRMTYNLGWKKCFLQPSTLVSPCKHGRNARVTRAKKTICHRLQNQKIKLTARLQIVYFLKYFLKYRKWLFKTCLSDDSFVVYTFQTRVNSLWNLWAKGHDLRIENIDEMLDEPTPRPQT